MAGMKRAPKRSTIREDWVPGPDDIAYAESRGVAVEVEAEKFLDYHLMHGTLLMSVAAAWRTWCRNAVTFGKASGQRSAPLLSLVPRDDPSDNWGIAAWIATLPDAKHGTRTDERVAYVGGIDVGWQAKDVCAAAGLPTSWRGDLSPIADWLRAGLDPDVTIEVILGSKKPDRPHAGYLRYFDQRVRERARAA
jgi:hypothetical protein